MIISKRTLPRRTFLRGAGACDRAAAARRDGAGAGAKRGADGEASRLHLYAERRRAKFRRHRLLDAEDDRQELRAVADPDSRSLLIKNRAHGRQRPRAPPGRRAGRRRQRRSHARDELVALGRALPSAPKAPTSRTASRPTRSRPAVLGKDTPLPSLELAIDLNFLSGQCENSYACIYMNTHRVALADEPAADREQSAARVRAAVRQRRHDGAARRARAGEPQHPRLRDGGLLAPRAHARPGRPRARRQLPRVRARGRAAHRGRRELERRRRPARARAAARHPREFRRPREAHVRAAVARVPGGPDARRRRSCSAAS